MSNKTTPVSDFLPPLVTPKKIGDTFISLHWVPTTPPPENLSLQVREVPHPWSQAREILLTPPSTNQCLVGSLLPTSTYEFRLVYNTGAGEEGKVLGRGVAVDTLPAGCNDSGKKGGSGGGCVLQ